MIARVNAWLDTLPRVWFDVGTRRVPAFRSLGVLGYHVAVVVLILTALRTGVSLGVALIVAAIAAALGFFGWALVRRAITKHETLVVMEHVWIAYGLIALFAWAIQAPIAPVFDVFSVGVATFLGFGRLACATVGCCHGYPSRFGITYGPDHRLPARLTGVRLFPVQLIEAGVLFLISFTAFLCTAARPGAATVWFLASYAVARFGLQRLRFDHYTLAARAPVAQAMCVLQLGAAVILDLWWLTPPRNAFGLRLPVWTVLGGIAAVTAAATIWVLLRGVRRRSELTHPDHLDEAWAAMTVPVATAQEPVASTTSHGMTVAASRFDGVRHVSFSHSEADTLPVALALGASMPFTRNGITHFAFTEPASELEDMPERVMRNETTTTASRRPIEAAYFSAPRA